MKLGKLLLAAVGATVLLGALVTSASARNLRFSSVDKRASWTRMDFTGGFGTIECEVVLEATFHVTTTIKSIGLLLGYATSGNINRCARGGATINRGSLPWHIRYAGFTGRLPLIGTITENIIGAEFRMRDPGTGVTCNVVAGTSTTVATYTLSAGTIARADVSGASVCRGIVEIEGELRGGTTNVDNRAGSRVTITLI
jgi:hypothetical protein